MTPRCHYARRRAQGWGFTLIEMMLVIALLTLFSMLIAPLFARTMKLNREIAGAHAALNQLDAVLGRLHQDVWHAQNITAPDVRTIRLQVPDGSTVTWVIGESGALTRTATTAGNTEGPLTWSRWPYRMSFAVNGPAVTVDVLPVDSTVPARYLLVSQVLLSRRMQP